MDHSFQKKIVEILPCRGCFGPLKVQLKALELQRQILTPMLALTTIFLALELKRQFLSLISALTTTFIWTFKGPKHSQQGRISKLIF